ncbi:TIGR02996 domain-containing protein [Gemmata sp.]|uniref:TIGR02996 domain-containing protein n=1 Tax=Gemmata sp. TaxID=1914242 RepID=UPI003F71187C
MSDGDALLAAIIANPDDDTPRLIYADWLDENGQAERAEFIRLQVARACVMRDWPAGLAQLLLDRYADEWARLGREAELLARNWNTWAEPFELWGRKNIFFRRGFVEELTCAPMELIENHLPLFQLKTPPSVVTIVPQGPEIPLADLLSVPHTPTCRLQLKGFYPNQGELELLTPNPPQLERHLCRGSWLVLVVRTDQVTELDTARRFHIAKKRSRCAVRKFDQVAGFSAWCPDLANSHSTPRWVWLEDGQVTRHQAGVAIPNLMRPR